MFSQPAADRPSQTAFMSEQTVEQPVSPAEPPPKLLCRRCEPSLAEWLALEVGLTPGKTLAQAYNLPVQDRFQGPGHTVVFWVISEDPVSFPVTVFVVDDRWREWLLEKMPIDEMFSQSDNPKSPVDQIGNALCWFLSCYHDPDDMCPEMKRDMERALQALQEHGLTSILDSPMFLDVKGKTRAELGNPIFVNWCSVV